MTSLTWVRDAAMQQRVGLRRADWRFLLPGTASTFQHLVLLGGPADLADRLLEHGIARRVSLRLPSTRSADAVAVLEGSPVRFTDAADCLRPGGVLYYEVDRRSPAHLAAAPGRVQGRMQQAGFVSTGAYWAAPDFARCRRYIPLDSPEAFRWYLATLFVSGTPLTQLLEIGLHLYAGAGRDGLAALAPCYALTAVLGPTPDPSAPSVLGHPAFSSELATPDATLDPLSSLKAVDVRGLRPVVLTSGQDDGSRVVILPFARGSRVPRAVLKVSTQPGFNRNTEQEQTVLAEVRARLSGDLRHTVPVPMGTLRYGDLTVGIESCAGGTPLAVTSGRWRASFQQQSEDLHLAARWLTEFHRQVHAGRVSWDETAIERWVETPLAAYARTFGLTRDERQLFAVMRARAQALAGVSLPLVWTHYDFGPWNLYRNRRQFTVIDWEFGRDWERDRFGPALYDLIYFVTYWHHVVSRLHDEAAEVEGLCRLFIMPDCEDPHVRAARQVLDDYMRTFEIDRRFLPLILVTMWVEQALHQFDRKRALDQLHTDWRAGNRSVRYLAALAGNVDPLFLG